MVANIYWYTYKDIQVMQYEALISFFPGFMTIAGTAKGLAGTPSQEITSGGGGGGGSGHSGNYQGHRIPRVCGGGGGGLKTA
jgi:hypothetical protein